MSKYLLLFSLVNVLFRPCFAQQDVRNFVFGHSLINHAFQVNPTPSQETSVPHWLHGLAVAGGHTYAVDGQFGFLPQHNNLPPVPNWGFDRAPGVWDSDLAPFADADFTDVMLTPGNFIQWQAPNENYYGETISPVTATANVINWCNAQEPGMNYYIYENWPDMAPFLAGDFPPSRDELADYHGYLNGDFHQWFLDYYDQVDEATTDVCLSMIPVGPVLSIIIDQAPYNSIPLTELYEDDAPHGRASLYFMAAMVTYMSMYGEPTPSDYQVEPEFIHPIIVNNYQDLSALMWEALSTYDARAQVSCQSISTNVQEQVSVQITASIRPNPVTDIAYVKTSHDIHETCIYNSYGQLVSTVRDSGKYTTINLARQPTGVYIVIGIDHKGRQVYSERLLKL